MDIVEFIRDFSGKLNIGKRFLNYGEFFLMVKLFLLKFCGEIFIFLW
jgi:hypothetical protein